MFLNPGDRSDVKASFLYRFLSVLADVESDDSSYTAEAGRLGCLQSFLGGSRPLRADPLYRKNSSSSNIKLNSFKI